VHLTAHSTPQRQFDGRQGFENDHIGPEAPLVSPCRSAGNEPVSRSRLIPLFEFDRFSIHRSCGAGPRFVCRSDPVFQAFQRKSVQAARLSLALLVVPQNAHSSVAFQKRAFHFRHVLNPLLAQLTQQFFGCDEFAVHIVAQQPAIFNQLQWRGTGQGAQSRNTMTEPV
jgi:hypothetical protein